MLKLEDVGLAPATEPLKQTFSTETFTYKGFQRAPVRCAVDVYEGLGLKIVIATELKENPGASITNTIELFAEAFEQTSNLPHVFQTAQNGTRYVLIEHYDPRSYGNPREGDRYSIVQFRRFGDPLYAHMKYYGAPIWFHMEPNEIQRLLGQEL